MTQQNYGSAGGHFFPDRPFFTGAPTLATNLVIDATGEKVAFSGRVWFKERTGTKDISRVGFRFGAVTKSGGSALTVSLQDVSAVAAIIQPDGTQDQTVAIANANAAFVSNTWIRTDALSANRTVSFGDMLSVVVEYDGSGRTSPDSVVVSATSMTGTNSILQQGSTLLVPATWFVGSDVGNLILEFSDGTFGTLEGCLPYSAINTHAFNSGSAADEFAQQFQFPFPVTVEGAWLTVLLAGTSSNFDVVLYEGTTARATVSVNAFQTNAIVAAPCYVTFATPYVVPANTTFAIAFKPTSANNITIYSLDLADANHRQAWGGGTAWAYTTRVDAGSWAAATTTRRILCGLRISAADDAAGGGGMGVSQGLHTIDSQIAA